MFTPLQQCHCNLHHNFVIIIIIVIVVIIVIVAIIVIIVIVIIFIVSIIVIVVIIVIVAIIVIIVIVIIAVIIIIIPFLYESPVCSGYIPQAPLMRSVNKCVHCTKLTKISSKDNLHVL